MPYWPRSYLFIALTAIFIVGAWWTLFRDPCLHKPARLGETAWGEGAFHSGVSGCARLKSWWQP